MAGSASTVHVIVGDGRSRHLLASDGTLEGTRIADELLPPGSSIGLDFGRAVVIGDQLFYPWQDGASESLWTVGLAEAEPAARMIAETQSFFFPPAPLPGRILFADSTQLWVSDDQAQAISVLWSANGSQQIGGLEAGPQRVFFLVANSDPSSEVTEWQVWSSSGTEEGTVPSKPFLSHRYSIPRLLSPRGPGIALVFTNSEGQQELRTWDGTLSAGLRFVHASRWLSSPIDVGPALVFADRTPETGLELWRADGRPWGLRQVGDLLPGPDSSNPRNFHIVGERLLFQAEDQTATQIWQIPLRALRSLRLRAEPR